MEIICYNDGLCNGTECFCRPGTNGTNCQDIIGCMIPKTLQIIPVGGIINYQCSGNSGRFSNMDSPLFLLKLTENLLTESKLRSSCQLNGKWDFEPICPKSKIKNKVTAILTTTAVLLCCTLSISVFYLRMMTSFTTVNSNTNYLVKT